MKKCPWCGEQYSDEYLVCAIDQNPLESYDPKPPKLAGPVAASNAVTPHTIAARISGACVIATIAPFLIWGLVSGVSEGFGVLAVLGGLKAVKIILFAAYIAFIMQGFRVHWGWGLANLLGPLPGIVFFIVHPDKGKVPIYILSHGVILLVVILIYLKSIA